VVVEMLTVSLVAIWFMPAGLVALVLSLLGVNVSVQILVYLACAGITLILAKTLLKNKIFPKKEATNADRIIGMQARVTEKIDPSGEIGEVKVDGKRWSAKMNDGGGAEEGDVVTIVRIQGVTVYCERSQTKVDD
jgi:membrane protein implicated in regulation of membrane protease activity